MTGSVLIVTEVFDVGGLETHVTGMARALRAEGCAVHMAVGRQCRADLPAEFATVIRDLPFDMIAPVGDLLDAVDRLVAFVRANRVDVVHAHPFLSLLPAALVAERAQVPLVVTLHGPASLHVSYGLIHNQVMKGAVLASAARVYCVSPEVLVLAQRFAPPARCRLLPNGVDLERFVPPAERGAGERWAIVGRLDAPKVEGLKDFCSKAIEVGLGPFDVIGSGPAGGALAEHVAGLGAADRFRFVGVRHDLDRTLGEYAGVVGMGRVALEGAAMDRPVVLVGYDGVKGLLDRDLAVAASRWNLSGRGLPTVPAAVLAQQLDALAAAPARFALRAWVAEERDERALWRRYREDVATLAPAGGSVTRRLEEVLRAHRDEPDSYLRALPVAAELSDACTELREGDPRPPVVEPADVTTLLHEVLVQSREREAEVAAAMSAVAIRGNDALVAIAARLQDESAHAMAAERETHRLAAEHEALIARTDAERADLHERARVLAERLREREEQLAVETAEREVLEFATQWRERKRRDWESRFTLQLERAKSSRRYRLGSILAAIRERPLVGIGRSIRWALGQYKARGWGLAEALDAWDPVSEIHRTLGLPGLAAATPNGRHDLVAIRLAARRAATAPWHGFAWEVPGLVSIVLPVVGDADRLVDAVDSVLAQTYADFELLVVEDGVSGNAPARLAAYRGHPRIRPLSQRNQGKSKALDHGFRLARGEFWTWIGAETRMDPRQLERQVEFLRGHPDVALVHADDACHADRQRNGAEAAAPTGTPGSSIGRCFLYRASVGRLLGDRSPIAGVEDMEYWLRFAGLFPAARLEETLSHSLAPGGRSEAAMHPDALRVRRERVLADNPVRDRYYARSWRVFVDDVTEFRLVGVPTAPHVLVPLDTTADALPTEPEEYMLLVHPGTLEWLARRALPTRCVVVVWFDVDDPSALRYGTELQRIAHLCLVADSATAERCGVFTRRVLRATTPRAALEVAAAFASDDLWTLKMSPDVDGDRTLPVPTPAPRPLRVLLEVQHFDVGGLERVVLDLASVLRAEGFEVVIAVLGRPGRSAAEAEREGFEVVTIPEAGRDDAYRQLLADRDIDLVNAHFSIAGAPLAAERGIPFVQTIHNTYVWLSSWEVLAYQQADAHTAAYACVSAAVAGDAERRLGISAAKLLVIPNGIELGRLDAARDRVRRAEERSALGWGKSDFVALCAASIAPPKAQLHLVRALAGARPGAPHLRLAFLGGAHDEEYAARVQDEIQRLEVGGAVDLLGYREDPQRFYFLADAFLLPSFIEGWSLALAEALYAGLPVLASDVGAARELLAQTGGHLVRGPLGNPGDWDASTFGGAIRGDQPEFVERLAAALVGLARSPEPPFLSQELADSFDRHQAMAAYARLFRWLVSGGTAASARPLVWELQGVGEGVRRLTARPSASSARRRARPPDFEPHDRSTEEVVQRARGERRPIVFLSSIEWNIWLFQRPQQLARHFARRGHPTIYDDSRCTRGFIGFREIEPNLFLFRGDPEVLAQLPDPLLWTFCYNYHLRDRFSPSCPAIYDVIDHLSVHFEAPELNLTNHRRALREAAVVAYVARQLEALLEDRPDRIYLPNGVDDGHFGDPSVRVQLDRDMQRIVREGKPIAGYYGALAQWFDYGLLARVAALRPDWNFVLIGQQYDDSADGQAAFRQPNVHWLGPRDYAVLPAYLRLFDVATIPFSINEITLATSPLKLYEYFAGGKPVITTAMPECMAFPEVTIARSARQFAKALDGARHRGQDPAFQARLRRIAQENSWAERVRTVERALDALPDAVAADGWDPDAAARVPASAP